MARVEWAVLCDLAYFDAYRNLCVIGVQTQARFPRCRLAQADSRLPRVWWACVRAPTLWYRCQRQTAV